MRVEMPPKLEQQAVGAQEPHPGPDAQSRKTGRRIFLPRLADADSGRACAAIAGAVKKAEAPPGAAIHWVSRPKRRAARRLARREGARTEPGRSRSTATQRSLKQFAKSPCSPIQTSSRRMKRRRPNWARKTRLSPPNGDRARETAAYPLPGASLGRGTPCGWASWRPPGECDIGSKAPTA